MRVIPIVYPGEVTVYDPIDMESSEFLNLNLAGLEKQTVLTRLKENEILHGSHFWRDTTKKEHIKCPAHVYPTPTTMNHPKEKICSIHIHNFS